MADDNTRAVRALRALARRVEHGLTKLHPVTEQQLAKVREAVRQQWEQTHPARAQAQSPETPRRARSKGQQQPQAKTEDHSQSHDTSHSHGHGHSQ